MSAIPPEPPAILPSPYREFPSVEAEEVARAAAADAPPPVVTPFAFDPTKPTIDQTRSNAIDSIRNNFAALNSAATIDPTAYLPKTGGVALDLTIKAASGPTTLFVDCVAGQYPSVSWRQAAVTRYDMVMAVDGSGLYWRSFDNSGAQQAGWPLALFRSTPLAGSNFGWQLQGSGAAFNTSRVFASGGNFDQVNNGAVNHAIQDISVGAIARQWISGNSIAYDWYNADNNGTARAQAGPPVSFRQGNTAGTLINRMVFNADMSIDINGAVCSLQSAPGGGSTPYTGTIDFRTTQTASVRATSNITGITMKSGQVGRIWVFTGGAITLPANVHLPQGGAVWGTVGTMISLWSWDGTYTLASFTPYDS